MTKTFYQDRRFEEKTTSSVIKGITKETLTTKRFSSIHRVRNLERQGGKEERYNCKKVTHTHFTSTNLQVRPRRQRFRIGKKWSTPRLNGPSFFSVQRIEYRTKGRSLTTVSSNLWLLHTRPVLTELMDLVLRNVPTCMWDLFHSQQWTGPLFPSRNPFTTRHRTPISSNLNVPKKRNFDYKVKWMTNSSPFQTCRFY